MHYQIKPKEYELGLPNKSFTDQHLNLYMLNSHISECTTTRKAN